MIDNHWAVFLLLGCLVTLGYAQQPADPVYDHQTATYVAKTQPLESTQSMTVTPFFSPDHSIDLETALVQSAVSTIKIGNPGFDSWGNCTWASNTTYGCTVAEQRNESFPIFAALLNAIHKGITVQILTNNESQPYYPGLIDPLGYLKLAGADVRYFTTLTFMHSKYLSVDGKKAAVSSVNFSKTSFMQNREAGLLLEDNQDIVTYLENSFDTDFSNAKSWETLSYDASDMAIINDKTPLPVVVPPMPNINNTYVTPLTPVTGFVDIQAFLSPDMAYDTITEAMDSASDIQVYIYQITDDMCDYISNHTKGIDWTIFVSNSIYDAGDYLKAKACYTRLYGEGMTIRKTAEHVYSYSHQKFWIVDRKTLFLSTGNWGESDYPSGSSTFPPYSSGPAWRLTNRDFTIKIVNEDILAIFQKVLDEDYSRGWDWEPDKY